MVALDDLYAISHGRALRHGGGPLTKAERAELRDEIDAWFFVPDDGPTSLEKCCAVIGVLDVDAVRSAVRRRGGIRIRGRCQLGDRARASILRALAKGVSTSVLAERYRINPAKGCTSSRLKHRTEWAVPGNFDTVFKWKYQEGSDALRKLYEKGKNLQWNTSTRIDWSQDLDPENPQELPDESISIFGSDMWNRLTR